MRIQNDSVYELSKMNYQFEVKESRKLWLSNRCGYPGIVTDIMILNPEKEVLYRNIAQTMDSEGTFSLEVGVYEVQMVHLTTKEELLKYYLEQGYSLSDSLLKELMQAFDNHLEMISIAMNIQ